MKITRKLLEKKLEILKGISRNQLNNAYIDHYALGGGYRIDNAGGYTLQNSRVSAKELAIALDMLISGLTIVNQISV